MISLRQLYIITLIIHYYRAIHHYKVNTEQVAASGSPLTLTHPSLFLLVIIFERAFLETFIYFFTPIWSLYDVWILYWGIVEYCLYSLPYLSWYRLTNGRFPLFTTTARALHRKTWVSTDNDLKLRYLLPLVKGWKELNRCVSCMFCYSCYQILSVFH